MSHTQGDAPPAGRITAPPLHRLAAVPVDGAPYLIIPALLVPVGLLLSRRGATLSSLAVNAIGFGLAIASATTWAVWWESCPRGRTPGKQLLTAVTYGWLLLNLILLIISSHRPVHDRLARTVVRDQKMVVTP